MGFAVLHYPDPDTEVVIDHHENVVDALDQARRIAADHDGDNFVLFPDTGELTRVPAEGPVEVV